MIDDHRFCRLYALPDLGQVLVMPDMHVQEPGGRPYGILVRCAHPLYSPAVHLTRPGRVGPYDSADEDALARDVQWVQETMVTFSVEWAHEIAQGVRDALAAWDAGCADKPGWVLGV